MTGGTGKPSSQILLLAAVVCHFTLARACTPAVIWCSHESPETAAYRILPSSPLQKMTSEEFESNLMQFNVTESVVAEELCAEDLCSNKAISSAVNGSKIFYFPCVIKPDKVYQKIYKQIRTIEDINDNHEFNMILKDIDSSGCKALAGKQCRYTYTERTKREALADNSTEFKIITDKVLLYSAKPLLFKVSEKSEEVQLSRSKVSSMSDRKEDKTVILSIGFQDVDNIGNMMLEFFFMVKNVGYYTLRKVTYGQTDLYTKRDITFPFNFSYHCSPKTIFANGTVYLKMTEMQVQIEPKLASFNDAYDCVGFTSIPIWTGIFVSAILGLIMILALIMILDIRTMDRFDDPKGKTITIGSTE